MFLLVLAHAVQAEVPKIAVTPLRVDAAELNKLWFDALKLLENKKFAETILKLTEVDEKKVESGLKNLPAHSAVLIKHANLLKQQGQLPEALKLLESARQLSPDFPGVYFAFARFRLAQKITDVYGIGQELWHGLFFTFRDINTLATYANNGLAFLLLSGALTGAVLILFLFAYYWRAIFFSLKELAPLPLPLFIANVLGWIVVGIITLMLGIFWGLLFLALLLIPHVDALPKRLLQVVLLFGSLVAVLLIVVSVTFTVFDGDYFQALRDVAEGNYATRTVNALQKRLQEHPEDDYALFGLAYLTRNMGNSQDAIAAYELISGQYPDQAAVQNNLGNLYQLQFRKTLEDKTKDKTWSQKAEDAYNSAINYAPQRFEPHYNLAQLLLLNFTRSEDANQQLEAARQSDMERFIQYSGYLEHKIFTVDVSFSTVTLLKKLSTQEARTTGLALAKNFWGSGSRFSNPWYFAIASVALLFMTLVSETKKGSRKKVNYCEMCGDPYTVTRKKAEDQKKFCTQCTYIFKKKTTVKAEKRMEKIQQIQLRQKIRGVLAKLGSVCFPGGGQIYLGYLGKGMLIAFIFYFILGMILLKFQTSILLGSPGASLLTFMISMLLVLGTYLFNLYDIFKLSPKNQ